jgi:transcriptional regulator with XRE-family HTH domain
MNQRDFGRRLGVTGAGISKIENGERNLTEQMLLLICKEFNINENWLRNGEGDIFTQKSPEVIEQLAKCYQLDELDQRIIYEYTMLDEKKRRVIKEYIMRIAYGNSYPPVNETEQESDIKTHGNISSVLQDGDHAGKIELCAETAEDKQLH